MESLAPNEYRCAHCQEVFTKGRSDEEAEAEFASEFPGEVLEESDLICDDCWNEFQAWRATGMDA